jgi:CRP-like cAMP-binding protein
MSSSAPPPEPPPETLAGAKARARQLAASGQHARAIGAADQLLALFPLDEDLRLTVADLLAGAGRADDAAAVYRPLAHHYMRSGRPLRALVAARALAALDRPCTDILTELAETYGAGAPRLATFASRAAPFDQGVLVPTLVGEDAPELEVIATRARQRALDLDTVSTYPAQLHPLPLLSELAPEPLAALLAGLVLHRLDDGQVVMRQGQSGTSFYFVAAGELRVSVAAAAGEDRQLARLHENSVFGEMALITSQPRVASVRVLGRADVFEVTREALGTIRQDNPAVQQVLDRFARERLIRNLLATSPLFTPFTPDQQADLLRRFEGTEVDPGMEIIRQGEPGRGLFVVLSGELEVAARTEGSVAAVPLGHLSTADIFGEMSLITSQPTSATVRALSRCNLLFLPRVYVDRLASAVPEVEAYFAEVASRRAADNSLRLGGAALPDADLDVDIDVDVDDEGALLL